MENCIFCKIIKGEIPSYKIYEDQYVYAFLDISCDAEGHTLVVPKKHFKNVLDCDQDYLNHVMNCVQKISNHYVNSKLYEGVNVLNNSNECAGQSVMHLHFHIIPRKSNDNFKLYGDFKKQELNLEEIHKNLKM